MYTYGFEKLEVWKEAKDFTLMIYKLSADFPESEKFGLINQLRRASISICSNIAEGSSYKSPKQQAHYSTMAFSSAVEIISHLVLALELGLISEYSYLILRKHLGSITNKINALKTYQIKKIK